MDLVALQFLVHADGGKWDIFYGWDEQFLAALTFGVFSFGLMVARFTGDRMNARLGPVRLVRAGMAVVAIAYGIVLLAASPALVLPGVLVVGVGVSNAIPLSFAAAGRIPPGGPSLAAVFTLCYAGFLGGPPVVGLIADTIGLATTLWQIGRAHV